MKLTVRLSILLACNQDGLFSFNSRLVCRNIFALCSCRKDDGRFESSPVS